jgi:hypothetical protein
MVLKVYVKCDDRCSTILYDHTGLEIGSSHREPPKILTGEENADYLRLEIDIYTGLILNWKVPSVEDVKEYLHEDEDQ